MRTLSSLLLTATLLVSSALTPVMADDWHGRGDVHHFGGGRDGHERWHGDIHAFHDHDYDSWRGGRWFHGFHEGRDGWWWMVGGLWYYYPTPVYPYPDPYTPPTVVVQTAPAPYGVAPSTVYYCANPAGYYPYVSQCYAPWQRVASDASGAPPEVQPQMMQQQPQPMPQAPSQNRGQREVDDRQLNAFSVEFQNVDMHDGHARKHLGNLIKQIEAFRQSLYDRSYNAMDILRDAERLQHRIEAQRNKLPKS